MLDVFQQFHEQIQRLPLVFLLGVLGRETPEVNALPEMIHIDQMLFPVPIQHIQHDLFFYAPHKLGADLLFFLPGGHVDRGLDLFAQGLFV